MLKRSKKDENNTPLTDDKTMEEKTVPSTYHPLISEHKTISEHTTTIGEQIVIEGSIHGQENLIINGTMKGNIEMGKYKFSIGPSGRLDGEIHAQDVSIQGQFKGTIKAQGRVAVSKEADFNGEIKAKSFSVEDGAYFKGVVELDREPHKKPAMTDSPGGPSSPKSGMQTAAKPAEVKMEK